MTDAPSLAAVRALRINEIVLMICYEVAEEYSYSPKKTLLALSRTSKIFSEAALDLLWCEQVSLVPLVKCMPETVWEKRGTGTAAIICLRRPIGSADMPRMLFYSVRVRTLGMDNVRHGALHVDLLRALDLALPPQGFMPLLSNFYWTPTKKQPLTLMRHFVGAHSRRINFNLCNLDDDLGGLSILPYIRSSCPLLSDFEFNATVNPTSVRLISDAVCGWQLAKLSVPSLDRAGLLHAANLPSLIALNLYCAKDTTLLHPPEFLLGSTFPALKRLYICCETARFCSGMVQVISSRQFETLSICTLSSWTTSAWQALHTTLRDQLDNEVLDSISVEEDPQQTRPADTASYVLSADAMRPLLAFKRLYTITYQISPGLDVDDAFLEEMASSWPLMAVLEFGTEVHVNVAGRPRATLQCLIPFARCCRHLSNLGVRINASHVPEFTQVPGRRITHPLEALYVGTSPINAMEPAVAAFISNLFPEIEYLFFTYSGDPVPPPFSAYQSSWNRVLAMIPVFTSVRKEEEIFWNASVDGSDDDSTNEEEEGEGENEDA
ncbi:hypothetical protein B0H16DRAFT_1464863 [Mycena metata]|uniref:F-box domain-containing protein n=1 Tax=Mycena metata TaxID=1033252 RepID=A0AAD7IFJ4_9AGAR|nr:hypothetical protein B0H16DRAFT_1464863 [Mycena metata]